MENQIDLAQLSTADLKRLQEVAAETIESRRAGEQTAALDEIKVMAEANDLTIDMISAHMTPKAKRGRKPGSVSGAPKVAASKSPPKYRHPETGATWTGKGRKPEWIKAVQDASVYLITAETAVAPVAKTPKPKATVEPTPAEVPAETLATAAE